MYIGNYYDFFNKKTFCLEKFIRQFMCKGLESDINISHIRVLAYIKANEKCIVTDISNYMEITLSAVTAILNKLVDKQMVIRQKTLEDRRIIYLTITSKGEEVLDRVWKNKNELIGRMEQGLTKEEISEFCRIQKKVINNLAENIQSLAK